MASPGLLLTQAAGDALLLIVLWIVYKRLGPFPPPLEPVQKPRRELSEIIVLYAISFSLSVIFWTWGLPDVPIMPGVFLTLRFFAIMILTVILEFGVHRRNPRDLGLIGFARTGARIAVFLVFFTVVWGFLKFFLAPSTDPAGPLLFLYWLLTPAFFEEWEFRSVYQTKLERSIGPERAWIASGLMFGLFHIPTDFFGYFWQLGGQDPLFSVLSLCLQTLFGFILGIVFTKTRSIWPVIAGHFLFDFFSMVLGWLLLVSL
jgi:membrane protease YdiL (CAAX protease family)